MGDFSMTPNELLDEVMGSFADDSASVPGATAATLDLVEKGDLWYVEQAGIDGMELACPYFLSMEVEGSFTLDTDTLDEVQVGWLRLYGDTQATLQYVIPADDIRGDIEIPTESAVSGEAPTRLDLRIRAEAGVNGTWTGDVKWLMEFSDGGTSDDSSVSTTNEPVLATWAVSAGS